MRASGSTQAVRHFDSAGDTGTEANTIIGSRHIIVHGLGNGHGLDAFLMEALRITQRVVATDRNEAIDSEEVQVLENLRGDVVDLVRVLVAQVLGDDGARQVTRPGARRVEKRAAGPARLVDDVFGQNLNRVREGQAVIVESLSEQPLKGIISWISPLLSN